ncbi:tripartite tricarboxylate transporter substrate binding protein [Thalassobaculum sp.]|uniref:Bug family tripartite tricarboxylate transporter substrate binding protein n=1 Tax=Thalassobaculum sp. TaxID=2022740 RepID=UPI0032ED5212
MAFTSKILSGLAGVAALGMMSLAAPAQAWEPNKPIDFVIMAGAGGGADQIARFLQSVAEKKNLTTRPLVPNNKGGGSGAEALIALKDSSDPDHTILVTLNSFFTTPLRQPKLGIDIATFTPIAMMGVDPFVLWVHKDSGIKTFEDWLKTVKAEPNYIMGGTGKGQEDSIVIAFMEKAFDIKVKYIPYKGGGAVAKDLAGKQIMATVNNPSETKGFYASGDVVPLLAFSDERMPAFPDVPTVKEKGQTFSYYNQRAVVGAPGMSADAAAYYQQLFKTIYETDEWQGYMKSESLSPLWMAPDKQKVYWTTQVENHKELLAASDQ